MRHKLDIISIGEQESTKGLIPAIRTAFAQISISSYRIKSPSEYPNKPKAFFAGPILINFDDGHIFKNARYQETLLANAIELRNRFPYSPIALRSRLFDATLNPETFEEEEIRWREKLDFDFALGKDNTTTSHNYVGHLLKNAFDRYNSFRYGNIYVNVFERSLTSGSTKIILSPELFNTFLTLARTARSSPISANELHQRMPSAPTTSKGVKDRITRLARSLKKYNFPCNVLSTSERLYPGYKLIPC